MTKDEKIAIVRLICEILTRKKLPAEVSFIAEQEEYGRSEAVVKLSVRLNCSLANTIMETAQRMRAYRLEMRSVADVLVEAGYYLGDTEVKTPSLTSPIQEFHYRIGQFSSEANDSVRERLEKLRLHLAGVGKAPPPNASAAVCQISNDHPLAWAVTYVRLRLDVEVPAGLVILDASNCDLVRTVLVMRDCSPRQNSIEDIRAGVALIELRSHLRMVGVKLDFCDIKDPDKSPNRGFLITFTR